MSKLTSPTNPVHGIGGWQRGHSSPPPRWPTVPFFSVWSSRFLLVAAGAQLSALFLQFRPPFWLGFYYGFLLGGELPCG